MNSVLLAFAKFRSSYGFMAVLATFAGIWIVLNTLVLPKAFDPYPFILLNLILSIEAGLMMPVIVMMNNKQSQADRALLEEDLAVDQDTHRDIEEIQIKLDKLLEMCYNRDNEKNGNT